MRAAMFMLIALAAAMASAAVVRPFPDTRDGIFIFADQVPTQLNAAQREFLASHMSGTQKVPPSFIDDIRSRNPDFLMLHYRLGQGDGPASILIGETWTNAKWTTLVDPQTTWFWMNGAQRIHQVQFDWYLMDIRQRGANTWTDYWLANVVDEMRTNHADGVFADSIGELIGGFNALPADLQGTGPNTALHPHVNTWFQAILDRFAATPEQFHFVPNHGSMVTSWDNVIDWTRCDGAMCEGFGDWGSGDLPGEESDWVLQMNRCLTIVRAGRALIGQHTLDASTAVDERMFLLGMYLLIKGDHTFLNLLVPEAGLQLTWFPEWNLALGRDVTPLPTDIQDLASPAWNGLYRRDYQSAVVAVNPTESAITANLGATYWRAVPSGGGLVPSSGVAGGSVSYAPVTQITLGVNRAAILFTSDPAAPGVSGLMAMAD